jgi:hypothetical protein
VASDTVVGQTGYWVDSILLTDPGGTFMCSGSALDCDDASVCTVDTCDAQTGCINVSGNAGMQCRPSSGETCDPAELCDGVSSVCPPDSFGDSTPLGNTIELSYDMGTATISWNDEAEPGPFNVYRGTRPSSGNWMYDHTCLSAGLLTTSVTDASDPGLNAAYYYLISRKTVPCFESGLGLDSTGMERPNDNPCP